MRRPWARDLIASAAIPFFAIVSSSTASGQWSGAAVDTLSRTGTTKYTAPQSLALDASNFAHVVWRSASYDPVDFRIWYATNRPGGSWSDPVAVSGPGANSPALALSPLTDAPFISFEENEAENSEIYVAYRDAGIWKQDRLTNDTTFDRFSTIAADGSDRVHVAWITQLPAGEFKIAYASGTPGNWHRQVLAGSVDPYFAFMAVTSAGQAHIVYRSGIAEHHLQHTWNDVAGGVQWGDEAITTTNDADELATLAIDAQGGLHLAVGGRGPNFDASPRTVGYLHRPAGGAWEPYETVATHAFIPSIAVRLGKPHIVWCEMDPSLPVRVTGRLFYARQDAAGTWNSGLAAGDDFFDPSFGIDRQGFGHIATATGGNSFQYDVYHLKSHEIVTDVPHGFESMWLHADPNPFRIATTLRFLAPTRAPVEMQIFDIAGRLVTTLVSKPLAPGEYWIDWNPRTRASGVYFCRLRTGSVSMTRKVTLVR